MGGLTEFEHEVSKIMPIGERLVALSAGDALRGSLLAREVQASIPGGAATVDQVAQAAATRYADHRRQRIDSELFGPRGISLREFYEGLQQRLIPPIAGQIDQQVMAFDYGLDVLIAGVDDGGGHVFSIHNPGGAANDFEAIGFHAIGSGALHALQSMIGFGHSPAHGLNDTAFRVYASKRRAEIAPGVGNETDMAVILHSGVTFLKPEILKELDGLYVEYQRPVTRELKEKVERIKLVPGGEEKGD